MSIPTIANRRRRSPLKTNRWAVIADHYVSLDLTHEDARTEAQELRERRQPGVVITTSEAARRISNGEVIALKAA
jgi:hypothetical protein